MFSPAHGRSVNMPAAHNYCWSMSHKSTSTSVVQHENQIFGHTQRFLAASYVAGRTSDYITGFLPFALHDLQQRKWELTAYFSAFSSQRITY